VDSRELAFAGAAEQARMLADGTITAPELLELYLERIARLDRELRSFRVVLADSARQEAGVAQERLNAGERLPLLGVPIAIKDDVDVAGEVTTYGSAAHGPARSEDAEVVRRLRAAGAVTVGKTAVPEMMLWSFTETLAYGVTRNPWNTDYAPGGSSGGSGAAVAAGLAAMALGSDGMGSIRIPATWCGLFGIKPQRDRVPLAPHDDAWCGLSVNGPIATRMSRKTSICKCSSIRRICRFLPSSKTISIHEFRSPRRRRLARFARSNSPSSKERIPLRKASSKFSSGIALI